MYESALLEFKEIYREAERLARSRDWTIDEKAILVLARRVSSNKVTPGERTFMVYFSFKSGARRALDFARFFGERNPELAALKRKQSELFGRCQFFAVQRRWNRVADLLTDLADIEEKFKESLQALLS